MAIRPKWCSVDFLGGSKEHNWEQLVPRAQHQTECFMCATTTVIQCVSLIYSFLDATISGEIKILT